MLYDLYFREMKIGVVTEDDSDFPNLWGTVTYDDSLVKPVSEEARRFSVFLELSCESMRLVDIEHEQDVSNELDALIKQLEEFNNDFETDDWQLITEAGERIPILCPIFRHGAKIVWRWNPSEKA